MSPARRVLPRRAVLWTSAVVVPLVVGAAILVPIAANGAVDLPDKSVKELIEFAAANEVDALSGTIEQSSELALPDLGGLSETMGGSASAPDGASAADIDDLIALATGSHTAKVYVDGESARLQVLDQLGERNVYVDGAAKQIWYVDSETQTATKLTLTGDAPHPERDADEILSTPDQMLDDALARLDDNTEVMVGTDSRVAGREVYELILEPRTADTLVGEVRFAIDGTTGVALAASVTARGASEPAFEVAFTQVDFSAPDPAVFAFAPGAGITVAEKDVALPNGGDSEHTHDGADAAASVIGEGWSAVVELPESDKQRPLSELDPEQRAMLDSVTTAVEGGRVLQTALVSVLITDDGRVFAGAVPATRLVEAAQTGR